MKYMCRGVKLSLGQKKKKCLDRLVSSLAALTSLTYYKNSNLRRDKLVATARAWQRRPTCPMKPPTDLRMTRARRTRPPTAK